MTTASGNFLPTGLRRVQLIPLTTGSTAARNGLPAASGSALSEGFQIVGGKAYTLTIPDARIIAHTGDDRVLARDILPPLDTSTAELRVARGDFEILALLTGTNVTTVAEMKLIGHATDKQGYEPQFGLLLYQQAIDTDTGAQSWRGFIIPKARIIPKPQGMQGDNPSEITFQVLPYTVTRHLWGVPFQALVEGFTETETVEIHAEGKPWIVYAVGNGSVSSFNFDPTRQAKSAGKVYVTVDGVEKTSGVDYTATVSGVTFTSPPASGEIIVIYYEH